VVSINIATLPLAQLLITVTGVSRQAAKASQYVATKVNADFYPLWVGKSLWVELL